MTKKNAEEFIRKISGDKALQERLKRLRAKPNTEILAELVRLGREAGYDFTLAEYRAAAKRGEPEGREN